MAVGPQEGLLIAAAATKYYRDGLTKVEIAQEMGLSRFKVARMLQDAQELGIVTIEITMPNAVLPELSGRLAEAYGLRRALIVDVPDSPDDQMRTRLGRMAAELTAEVIQPGHVVGVAWGRTLGAMSSHFTQLAPCEVVQLTGASATAEVDDNAVELVRRMSALAGGKAFPIFAPMLLEDAAVAASLRDQPQVAAALEQYRRVDVAVIPIGSWDPPISELYDAVPADERGALLSSGVCADSASVQFSASGQILEGPLGERIIGITGQQLADVGEVIAVAGGRAKAEAIRAVLRSGVVTSLITNATAAEVLLEP